MNPILTPDEIHATTARRANGWAAVLEYPNGGRQMFSQRFGTMEEAEKEARKLKGVRLKWPQSVIDDPQPNALQDLSPGGNYVPRG